MKKLIPIFAMMLMLFACSSTPTDNNGKKKPDLSALTGFWNVNPDSILVLRLQNWQADSIDGKFQDYVNGTRFAPAIDSFGYYYIGFEELLNTDSALAISQGLTPWIYQLDTVRLVFPVWGD